MTPVLISQRLLLRPFEHEDAPALALLLNDPGVAMGICSAPLPFTTLHASARILMIRAREVTGKDYVWAVEDMDGTLIGNLGLSETTNGTMRLGYAYARNQWGKGYATEALTTVLDWVSRHVTIGEIRAEAFLDNPASARVLAIVPAFRWRAMDQSRREHLPC
jgi:RimJ/RimL family protein N-acetyltransferase